MCVCKLLSSMVSIADTKEYIKDVNIRHKSIDSTDIKNECLRLNYKTKLLLLF